MPKLFRPLLRAGLLCGALALAACGEGDKSAAPPANAKLPPALLQFDGYIYVAPDTSDFKLIEKVRSETHSALGKSPRW